METETKPWISFVIGIASVVIATIAMTILAFEFYSIQRSLIAHRQYIAARDQEWAQILRSNTSLLLDNHQRIEQIASKLR